MSVSSPPPRRARDTPITGGETYDSPEPARHASLPLAAPFQQDFLHLRHNTRTDSYNIFCAPNLMGIFRTQLTAAMTAEAVPPIIIPSCRPTGNFFVNKDLPLVIVVVAAEQQEEYRKKLNAVFNVTHFIITISQKRGAPMAKQYAKIVGDALFHPTANGFNNRPAPAIVASPFYVIMDDDIHQFSSRSLQGGRTVCEVMTVQAALSEMKRIMRNDPRVLLLSPQPARNNKFPLKNMQHTHSFSLRAEKVLMFRFCPETQLRAFVPLMLRTATREEWNQLNAARAPDQPQSSDVQLIYFQGEDFGMCEQLRQDQYPRSALCNYLILQERRVVTTARTVKHQPRNLRTIFPQWGTNAFAAISSIL